MWSEKNFNNASSICFPFGLLNSPQMCLLKRSTMMYFVSLCPGLECFAYTLQLKGGFYAIITIATPINDGYWKPMKMASKSSLLTPSLKVTYNNDGLRTLSLMLQYSTMLQKLSLKLLFLRTRITSPYQ